MGRRRIATDPLLLALCLVASGLGLVLICSATRYQEALHGLPVKQLISWLAGVVLCELCARLDGERLLEHPVMLLLAGVGGLLLLLTPLGTAGDTGNRSWLIIPGIPFHIQPAEFSRLCYLLLLAGLFQRHREDETDTRLAAEAAGVTLIFCGLLFIISGDAGMVVLYGGLFLLVCWVGGIRKRWFLLALGMLGVAAVGVWLYLPSDNYWKMRVLILFDHSLDPQKYGYQQTRSLLALGSGQLWGQSLFQGTQTQSQAPSSLPARYTDFIFSVCGEELGFVGCTVVLLLLTGIILRSFWIGYRCPSPAGRLICVGVGGMVLIQTVLNVGMCLYAAPVIGLTLPFFSYGGSSILSLYCAMGLVSGFRRKDVYFPSPGTN